MIETGGMGVVQQTVREGGFQYLVSHLTGRLSPPIGSVLKACEVESLIRNGLAVAVRAPSVGEPFRHLGEG